MSYSPDIGTIVSLYKISNQISQYFSVFIFLFGSIGNLLNIFILLQRTLRTNPCSLYFLVSSVANLIAILSGLIPIISTIWTPDLTNTINWLCKFRLFIVFSSKNLASWTILLAAIDRWLVSNVDARRRQISTLKNAERAILISTILSLVIYSPVLYCFQANLINAPIQCYSSTRACLLSNDLIYACLTYLMPTVFMFIFGCLTIINIQQVKNRVHLPTLSMTVPSNSAATGLQTQISKKKLDHRLVKMLIIQILLLGVFTLPQSIQKLYSSITSNQSQTPLQTAINSVIFTTLFMLTYVANGMPFYIYTLSGGKIFRNALKSVLQKIGNPYHF